MSIRNWIGDPCSCPACRQAGITDRPVRRDPRSGENLHGYALKRWYAAYDEFRAKAREAVGAKGRHGNGFEKLVKHESRSPDGDGHREGDTRRMNVPSTGEQGTAGSEPADSHSTAGGFEPLGKPQWSCYL